MSKRIKILLIVLGILIVAAAVMWFLTQGGVSADVVGTTGEKSGDEASDASIVKIDDNVTVVNPGQTLSYTITVDTKKMFEQMSGLSDPTEGQFNDWKASNKLDKLFVNAWLANGKSASNNSWILTDPNFSVGLPELKYPLSEVKYVATATVPSNISLIGNKVVNSARVVRRPCHVATSAEILNSITHPPKLKTTSLICPMENRVRIAQNVDKDVLSYKTNTTDLGIIAYNVSETNISVDEGPLFTVQYKNLGTQIAGNSRLKIRYPENTFLISDPSIKPAIKETIDGRKYDVYYINLGNLLPTVNGTVRTDATTIAAIKTSLQAALVDNTDSKLAKAINDAIKITDAYATGTKSLAELQAAVKVASDLVGNKEVAIVNDSTSKSWLSSALSNAFSNPVTSFMTGLPLAISHSLIQNTIAAAGGGSLATLSPALQAFINGNAAISTLSPALLAELTGFLNNHISLSDPHPAPVRPLYGAATITALSQATQYCAALATSTATPAQPLVVSYYAKALIQARDLTGVVTYVELLTNSTDIDESNNLTSNRMTILSPQMWLESSR